jgi:hypothetical protein
MFGLTRARPPPQVVDPLFVVDQHDVGEIDVGISTELLETGLHGGAECRLVSSRENPRDARTDGLGGGGAHL